MQVMQGWSGEVQPNRWAKVDVTLNEVDLMRLLLGHGVEIAPEQVPIALAFQLLDAEAERYILVKLIKSHGYPPEQGKNRLIELAQVTKDVMTKIHHVATRDG